MKDHGPNGTQERYWLARALPSDGRLTTLEIDPGRAALARSNLDRCGLGNVVDVRVGPALETLMFLKSEGTGPFDGTFIDADKSNHPHYLDWAIQLSHPDSVIIGDNVVRGGAVSDARISDPDVEGSVAFWRPWGGTRV